MLSHSDGHLGCRKERLVEGGPGRLLLPQLLLQPLEKLLGWFPAAQPAEAAEEAVVQGGLQRGWGENRHWGCQRESRADAKVSPAPSMAPGKGVAWTDPKG